MRARWVFASSLLIGQLLSSSAQAAPVRFHATGAAARATGEFQKDEFGWGVAGLAAAELGLSREFGLELELGGLWLSESGDPVDPTVMPQGAGAAGVGGLGLRLRPFASTYKGKAVSAAGLWLSAHGGLALTGGLVRPMFDAGLGFDFLFSKGRAGVGPTVGYLHVLQPNDEFRPQDANLLFVGVHAMFDTAGAKLDGDADRDGIRDSIDRCPTVPEDKDGFEDTDGCPELDNDKDGILDADDKCPNDPEDKDGFEDEDGCPELDNDKDGILDADDKCPNDPEDKDGFEDADGCPDKDNDQDGILDGQDQCPNEPETKNNYADEDGCPDEERVRVLGDKILLDDRIHFRTNNAKIRPISYPLLERLAKLIKDHPEYVHIDIEGHADERGPEWFNQQLSENRANSVLEFLVKRGIDRSRLTAKGFGTSQPRTPKSSEYAWLLNRRVEFRVTRAFDYTGPKSAAPDTAIPEGMPGADLPRPGEKDDEGIVVPKNANPQEKAPRSAPRTRETPKAPPGPDGGAK